MIRGLAIAILFAATVRAEGPQFDAVVRITAGNSMGTGTVFHRGDGKLYVLTNYHVVHPVPTVGVEFWRDGHKSRKVIGQVEWRAFREGRSIDMAVVGVVESQLGGVRPTVVPFGDSASLRAGQTVISCGCAKGAWATAWTGHVLKATPTHLYFDPPPANGRSGSAIFAEDGKSIVGLIAWRTSNGGLAMPINVVKAAMQGQVQAESLNFVLPVSARRMGRSSEGWTGRLPNLPITPIQCGPYGCPQPQQPYVQPYGQGGGGPPRPFAGSGQYSQAPSPWPTYPFGSDAEVRPVDPVTPQRTIDIDALRASIQSLRDDLAQHDHDGLPQRVEQLEQRQAETLSIVSRVDKSQHDAMARIERMQAEISADVAEGQRRWSSYESNHAEQTTLIERVRDEVTHRAATRVRSTNWWSLGRAAATHLGWGGPLGIAAAFGFWMFGRRLHKRLGAGEGGRTHVPFHTGASAA